MAPFKEDAIAALASENPEAVSAIVMWLLLKSMPVLEQGGDDAVKRVAKAMQTAGVDVAACESFTQLQEKVESIFSALVPAGLQERLRSAVAGVADSEAMQQAASLLGAADASSVPVGARAAPAGSHRAGPSLRHSLQNKTK